MEINDNELLTLMLLIAESLSRIWVIEIQQLLSNVVDIVVNIVLVCAVSLDVACDQKILRLILVTMILLVPMWLACK